MEHPQTLRHVLLALSLGLGAMPSWAGDDCDAPLHRWQTREAVRDMAAAQGWQIQRLKIDDGCYEIRGTDAQGRSFKAKIDPETLKVLKIKQSKHQRDHKRDRDRDHEASSRYTQPQSPDNTAEPTPLSNPGTLPRGQIE